MLEIRLTIEGLTIKEAKKLAFRIDKTFSEYVKLLTLGGAKDMITADLTLHKTIELA